FLEAQKLLMDLDALDDKGRITDEGRAIRALPLPPRLARMVIDAAREGEARLAADIALLVTERGLGGDAVDLTHRLDNLHRDRSRRAEEARRMAARWAVSAGGQREARGDSGVLSPGAILSLAYPDRIARSRGSGGSFLLANGRGASVDPASSLAREPFLAVAELTGAAAQSRILLAAPISLAEIEQRFADRIEQRDEITVDSASLALRARKSRRLGAVVLSEQIVQVSPNEDTARRLARAVASAGLQKLPWTDSLLQWRDRVAFLRRAEGDEWPDLSDAALAAKVDEWLAPLLVDKVSISALSADELRTAITNLLPWNLRRRLDVEAPTHFEAPTGTRAAIDYTAEAGPSIAIRVQELFGLDRHPSIADGRVPLVVELLSPANRPVQVTRDLPGFWRGSYQAVKAEMKGRYPRHPWPDDPMTAPATRRAKPRSS
ncbi:MAG: ATP-dependent helicase HrpB, partial [Proteobacteria bacterium]